MRFVLALPQDEAAVVAVTARAFEAYARGLGRDPAGPYPWMAGAIARGEVFWIEAESRVGVVIIEDKGAALYIEQIAIEPQMQGAGLGRRALEMIEQIARERGAARVEVNTAQAYPQLVAYYSQAGYLVEKVGPTPSGRDAHPRVFLFKPL